MFVRKNQRVAVIQTIKIILKGDSPFCRFIKIKRLDLIRHIH